MPIAEPVRILTLQPFYGGSHRQFIDSWISNSSLSWQTLHLPARHWKWRMRHAAVYFAAEVDRLYLSGQRWELLVCTDILNLAEFKGLLTTAARNIPTLVYFHENQLEYPDQQKRERDFHFAFTNFTTALAADLVWFNSAFNRDTMLDQLRKLAGKWPDYAPAEQIQVIADKIIVQAPGVEFPIETQFELSCPPHLVWAARWEHDKNPALLLEILHQLRSRQVDFQLSVLGQQFAKVPEEFELIARDFSGEIRNWGFLSCRDQYFRVLSESDVILSTANHEFFGLSVVEAVCCGCMPLLPNRIVYPELLRAANVPARQMFLYESVDEAVDFVANLGQSDYLAPRIELTDEFQNRYTWSKRARQMDDLIIEFLAKPRIQIEPDSVTNSSGI